MKSRVYIETTIPSFYHNTRTDAAAVARQQWTYQWWDKHLRDYEVLTSVAVLNELQSDAYPTEKQALCLDLMDSVSLVAVEPDIIDIVQIYINHQVMPRDPAGDALHLALASYHKCDFLLTWNCKHLANANKFGHIRRVNTLMGLFVPNLVTPLELLGDD